MRKPERNPFSRPGVNKFWHRWIDGKVYEGANAPLTKDVIKNWPNATDAWLAGFKSGVDWTLIPFKQSKEKQNEESNSKVS